MPLPPWVNPPNFLGAIQAGTQAGISLRNSAIAEAAQRQRAQEAAAQLAFHYTQLQAQNERAAAQVQAEQERAMAANMLRAQQQNAMQQWREQQERNNAARIGIEQDRFSETKRHNLAMETISMDKAKQAVNKGDATIVEHPEVPGVKFLRQPTGHEIPIERPPKDMTPAQIADLNIRAYNMMKPEGSEIESTPSYQARTNFAGNILRQFPMPTAMTNAPPSIAPQPEGGTGESDMTDNERREAAISESVKRYRFDEKTGKLIEVK